jgi:hypothetical protein
MVPPPLRLLTGTGVQNNGLLVYSTKHCQTKHKMIDVVTRFHILSIVSLDDV